VSRRLLTAGIAVAVVVVFACLGALTMLAGAAVSACTVTTGPSGATSYDPEQVRNARTIIQVGAQRGIPPRGQVIAVATAIQESSLRNLGNLGDQNDHDSLGLFQQRPSQGWGTPEQIMNPVHAAGRFYDKLLTIAGWETMPLTDAAQAVQRSAYPDAYAKWETDATTLVTLATGQPGSATPMMGQQCISAAGWMNPVAGTLVSGFRTADRPGHDGVDINAAKGTPIRAAAAGEVITVECNAHLESGGPYSCDVDGHFDKVRGCGWYAELLHPDQTVTRYCHMVSRPTVQIGQHVSPGQIIGQVGSSGHSSGPHLHLETHTSRPANPENAVDPIVFFAQRGIDLGSYFVVGSH